MDRYYLEKYILDHVLQIFFFFWGGGGGLLFFLFLMEEGKLNVFCQDTAAFNG